LTRPEPPVSRPSWGDRPDNLVCQLQGENLLGFEPSGSRQVVLRKDAIKPGGVEAMDPVAQRLSVHSAPRGPLVSRRNRSRRREHLFAPHARAAGMTGALYTPRPKPATLLRIEDTAADKRQLTQRFRSPSASTGRAESPYAHAASDPASSRSPTRFVCTRCSDASQDPAGKSSGMGHRRGSVFPASARTGPRRARAISSSFSPSILSSANCPSYSDP
jgi:hypothetical protein